MIKVLRLLNNFLRPEEFVDLHILRTLKFEHFLLSYFTIFQLFLDLQHRLINRGLRLRYHDRCFNSFWLHCLLLLNLLSEYQFTSFKVFLVVEEDSNEVFRL